MFSSNQHNNSVATMCFIYPSAGATVMGCILFVNGAIHLYMVFTKHPACAKEEQELREKGFVKSAVADELGSRATNALTDSVKAQFMKGVPSSSAPAPTPAPVVRSI
eukprot:c1945_g1_i1.p4 GENE.c1945_g1_i1~~c1945_g1_i1.p4  ORF type:complete len:107 (-),score=18.37 c1945_g1_i1:68-388(-)